MYRIITEIEKRLKMRNGSTTKETTYKIFHTQFGKEPREDIAIYAFPGVASIMKIVSGEYKGVMVNSYNIFRKNEVVAEEVTEG